jgi:ABC-2 type transport system ATP-binding protein
MIRLDRVSKTYPNQHHDRPALRDLSLEITRGEMLAVIGPNGAGKSTLLGMLSGVLSPTAGQIEGKPTCAVVLQRTALDPLLTVRENAVLFARVYGVPQTERATRLNEATTITGLAERLDARVGTLSGGLARRADLLRALMVGPELLILDEPAAGLDREAHKAIGEVLDTLRHKLEIAIVYATHDMADAARADRVILLREGEVLADESPRTLIDTLGFEVVIERESDGDPIRCARAEAAREAGRLIERGERCAVREASLEDVYDHLIGARP